MSRKMLIYSGVGLFIAAGIAATPLTQKNPEWKNLKVIPKNTDEDQMDRIMHQFSRSLSVTCSYCHPDTKPDIFPRRVDFASDENPEKLKTREMMRMTDKINKKYFNYKNNYDFESFKNTLVTCRTCHRGLRKPINMRLYY